MRIEVDEAALAAPYEQIRDQVIAGIMSGALPVGARLPTVRQLAADLGVAVNTVAKSYRRLEAEGHVATQGRNGTVVLSFESGRQDPVSTAAAAFVKAAQGHGLDLSEAIGILRRTW